MPRKFRGSWRSPDDAERRAAQNWLNDRAAVHLRRAGRLMVIMVVVFGILLPIAQFTPIKLAVIALALGTIGAVSFASRAGTSPAMLARTMLAVGLLAATLTVAILVAKS